MRTHADDLFAVALFTGVAAFCLLAERVLALYLHPAVIEGETIVEAEAVVVEAERALQRHGRHGGR